MRAFYVSVLISVLATPAISVAQKATPNRVQAILAEDGDRFPSGPIPGHVPASVEEPLAKMFSLEKAAQSMDLAARNWQSQPRQQCSQCHANMLHLVARPLLSAVVPETPEVRQLFEQHIVANRWEKHGLLYDVESVAVAVPLAIHDRQTTGKLHPITKRALDRMVMVQKPDGTWGNTAGGKHAFFLQYEQTMFAAVGIAAAPDGYAETELGRQALGRIREFVSRNSPRHVYAMGMLLWASSHINGLASTDDRMTMTSKMLSSQRPEGGWALRQMLLDDPRQPAGQFAAELPSDGYGTGFAVFVLRKSGIPAEDPHLVSGVAWLKSNQRASGRWFHPTLSDRPNHVLSNSATAWAVMALRACEPVIGAQQ